MPKKRAPTISLPFTTFEQNKVNSSVWFGSSRLRKRASVIFVSLLAIFLTAELLMHPRKIQAPRTKHLYEGPLPITGITNLIIVAGHAIWLGGHSVSNDSNWILESFQAGQTGVFVEHIRKGEALVKADPKALLVFSGGETRTRAGTRSEAQSYWALLEYLESQESFGEFMARVTTEEFARDSYENLLFSIARFFEVTGTFPEKVTVVGFEFKRHRFTNLHRKAIQFPLSRFVYVGVDPPIKGLADIGEQENAISHFSDDFYGCNSPSLLEKKQGRNPWRRMHGYLQIPELADLLAYCPKGNDLFQGPLPWV